ncbi:MAG: twin-arginine translocase subunit TatC, partial [Acidobacteriaceae bacterium]
MVDLVERARAAVGERVDLPGMSLLEHLQELRKRIVYSLLSVAVGFGVAYGFRERIAALMIEPITKALADNHLPTKLAYLNPMDPFNFFLKIGLFGGIIL